MANHHDIMAKLRRHIVKTKTYTWRREYKTCRKYIQLYGTKDFVVYMC